MRIRCHLLDTPPCNERPGQECTLIHISACYKLKGSTVCSISDQADQRDCSPLTIRTASNGQAKRRTDLPSRPRASHPSILDSLSAQPAITLGLNHETFVRRLSHVSAFLAGAISTSFCFGQFSSRLTWDTGHACIGSVGRAFLVITKEFSPPCTNLLFYIPHLPGLVVHHSPTSASFSSSSSSSSSIIHHHTH